MFIKKKSANFLRRKPLTRVEKAKKDEKNVKQDEIINIEVPEVQSSTPKRATKKVTSVVEATE